MKPSQVPVALLVVVLGLAALSVTVIAVREGSRVRRTPAQDSSVHPDIKVLASQEPMPQDAATYGWLGDADAITAQPSVEKNPRANTRTLNLFYARRAYVGAPPFIPHELDTDMKDEGMYCLTCHRSGGYVPRFNKFAPIVPHPERVNCRQCHLPVISNSLFRETNWESVSPPDIHRAALSRSPPQIPHSVFQRENCLSCHGGAGAVKELRSTHPERLNCRQCHAEQPSKGIDEEWSRP